MAIDYVFVGIVLAFASGMIFMLLGFENREMPNVVIYHFLASILFFLQSQFFLMAYTPTTAVVLPLWMWFFGLGLTNFMLFMVWIWQVFALVWRRRQGLVEEE